MPRRGSDVVGTARQRPEIADFYRVSRPEVVPERRGSSRRSYEATTVDASHATYAVAAIRPCESVDRILLLGMIKLILAMIKINMAKESPARD